MSGRQWSPWQAACLRGGDPDFRPTDGTVTKPGVVSVYGRRAYFFGISGCLSRTGSVAGACDPLATLGVFAGWNAAASVAASGPDFPWFQPLLAGGEPVCRSSGHVYLSSADPARHVSHLFPVAALESIVWLATDKSLAGLFWLLMRLPNGWQDVDERWQYLTLLPWLLVIGWRFRAFSAAPAVCLAGSVVLAFPLWHRVKTDSWSLHMLDVGQGLAMVIERHGKAICMTPGWHGPVGTARSS